jgi:aryl-alcohol dehydrogenase-like predicted oxidoreductase
MGILTYSPLSGGWLSGSWGADSSPTSPARQRLAARFDMSLPENQRKLEAVDQLQQVAEDSQLPAADVRLEAATLDRIDEIVKPDTSYGEQVLQPAVRRR